MWVAVIAGFASQVALLDHVFLNQRHVFRRQVYAQISAGNHQAVGYAQDGVQVLHSLVIFDLGDDLDVVGLVLVEDMFDLENIFGFADEGLGDDVDVLLNAELDVPDVLLGYAGKAGFDAGNVDALALLQLAAVLDEAVDLGAFGLYDLQTDQTVIDQDDATGLHILGKLLVGDLDAVLGAEHFLGGQNHGFTRYQLRVVRGHFADANFRTFDVEQDGNVLVQLLGCFPDAADALRVLVQLSVGEVQAGDVHACLDQPPSISGLSLEGPMVQTILVLLMAFFSPYYLTLNSCENFP